MNSDELQQAWKTQPAAARISVDANLLLTEVQRNQRTFDRQIFWRDVRELVVCAAVIPFWVVGGIKLHMPLSWYLTLPALVWIAGCMLHERYRARRAAPYPDQSLRTYVKTALADVRHQIRLLENVLWWYLLPLAVPVQLFLCELAWEGREAGGTVTSVIFLTGLLIQVVWVGGLYMVNQSAVKQQLRPREQELERLLAELGDGAEQPA